MKKYALAVVIVLSLIVAASLVYAAQQAPPASSAGQGCSMMGGMDGQMCGGSDSAAAISVSDYGVYVVKGDSVYKFDLDLKLRGRAALAPEKSSSPAAAAPEGHSQHQMR